MLFFHDGGSRFAGLPCRGAPSVTGMLRTVIVFDVPETLHVAVYFSVVTAWCPLELRKKLGVQIRNTRAALTYCSQALFESCHASARTASIRMTIANSDVVHLQASFAGFRSELRRVPSR